MTIDEVITAIESIRPEAGYVYFPSEVTKERTKRVQGVQVSLCGDMFLVKVNAEGKTLDRIQESIAALIGSHVIFEEPKDGIATTTADDGGEGGNCSRDAGDPDGS